MAICLVKAASSGKSVIPSLAITDFRLLGSHREPSEAGRIRMRIIPFFWQTLGEARPLGPSWQLSAAPSPFHDRALVRLHLSLSAQNEGRSGGRRILPTSTK